MFEVRRNHILVGGFKDEFYSPFHIWDVILPNLTNSFFSRWLKPPPTSIFTGWFVDVCCIVIYVTSGLRRGQLRGEHPAERGRHQPLLVARQDDGRTSAGPGRKFHQSPSSKPGSAVPGTVPKTCKKKKHVKLPQFGLEWDFERFWDFCRSILPLNNTEQVCR